MGQITIVIRIFHLLSSTDVLAVFLSDFLVEGGD